jgi:hypothetical protein
VRDTQFAVPVRRSGRWRLSRRIGAGGGLRRRSLSSSTRLFAHSAPVYPCRRRYFLVAVYGVPFAPQLEVLLPWAESVGRLLSETQSASTRSGYPTRKSVQIRCPPNEICAAFKSSEL